MRNILDCYLEFTSNTESPTQYHRWSFLSAVGAGLSRNVLFPFGHGYIAPNMYTMLVGATGARKSTAISIAKKLLQDSGYSAFTPNKTTKAKFLLDMVDGFEAYTGIGVLDAMERALQEPLDKSKQRRDAFIVADEMVDFIGPANYDFLTTLTTLWDFLPFYADRIKNTQSVHIPEPTVSILGGATPANLQKILPVELQGHGFLSRTVFVFSEPSGKKITFPQPPAAEEREVFVDFFRKVLRLRGTATLTPEAAAAVDAIYHRWENRLDTRFDDYASRRLVHLLKMCMICAALRLDTTIAKDDVVHANTILLYTEAYMPNALGEFGMARNSHIMQKLLQALARKKQPMHMAELMKEVASDLERASDFLNVLGMLKKTRKIIVEDDYIALAPVRHVDLGNLVDYKRYITEFSRDPYAETSQEVSENADNNSPEE
jgi:hypothetical protein